MAGDDIDPEEYTPEVLDELVPTAIRNLIEARYLSQALEPHRHLMHGGGAQVQDLSAPAGMGLCQSV